MIYNYTTCESVIAKIMADLNISQKKLRITDIREWIFEAVDKIGAPMQYVQKESGVEDEPILKIRDYQVPIPVGLQHLDAVGYSTDPNGPWRPMRSNTADFRANKPILSHVPSSMYAALPERPLSALDKAYEAHSIRRSDVEQNAVYPAKDELVYFIKPGWIVTNKKEGYVKLAYKQIATDGRGYPLIPDLSSYQEAIFWYVAWKLSLPKYLKGQLGGKGVNSAQNVYFYLQQQWNFFRGQAYAEAMMPNADQMRSIKNEWTKLVPDWAADDNFFESVGERQNIYNDYYYGY